MKYCTNCGSPIPDEAKFCAYCGAKQLVVERPKPAQEPVPEPAPSPQPEPELGRKSSISTFRRI